MNTIFNALRCSLTRRIFFVTFVTVFVFLFVTVARAQTLPLKAQTTMTQIAKGSFVVALKPLPFEGVDASAKLGRMSIDKQISGDLVATTKGEMLSAMTNTKGSAGYVAIEHVTGTLNGRKGSFVLQHTGTMNKGAPSLSVTVVPDSGTDELIGLEGMFKIDIVDGKHFYEFQYKLAQ
jgi:Protein of unknown function (DUF3224)